MKVVFGVDLVLIIVDTMSAAAGFKDENASSEGQFAMNVLNDLSKRTGAHVLACDHFGKAIETGTRGTSAKEASADVIIACLGDKTQAGNVNDLRIAVRKLRGGATGAETPFRLRTVDMGVDEDGEPITTCVVEWSPVSIVAPVDSTKSKRWPKWAIRFRAALIASLKLHGTEQRPISDGVTVFAVELDRVRAEFDTRYPLEPDDRKKQFANRRQAFKRAREEAEARGLIGGREINGKFMVWLTRPEEEGVTPPSISSGVRLAGPCAQGSQVVPDPPAGPSVQGSQRVPEAPASPSEQGSRRAPFSGPPAPRAAASQADPWADLGIPEFLHRS